MKNSSNDSIFQYNQSEIKLILDVAVKALVRKEKQKGKFSSESGLTEWNLAHHLACLLEGLFPFLDCDIEITKGHFDNKRPDIIIHKRGNNDNNILVIEMKRGASSKELEEDREKIRNGWFKRLHYQFGAIVNIEKDSKGCLPIEIFKNENHQYE